MKRLVEKFGKNKVYAGIAAILIFAFFLVVGIVYIIQENKEKLFIKQEVVTVELGNAVSIRPSDYLSDEMSEENKSHITIESTLLTDSELYIVDDEKQTVVSKDKEYLEVGSYKIIFTLGKEVKELIIDVKDTNAPAFIALRNEIKVEQNAEAVDFAKYFEAEDLSEVTILVDDKNVDLASVGEYEATVTAQDTYENKIVETIKVIVVSMEEAQTNGVSEMVDGTIPQSEALKKKIEEEKREEEKKAQDNSSSNSTKPAGGTGNNRPATPDKEEQPLPPAEPVFSRSLANECMAKINAWRVEHGVQELKHDSRLQGIADQRAMELIMDFSHNGAQTAENIAKCYGYNGAYQDFFTAWKNSPGHNQNQLTPYYQTFAVSIIYYNEEWFGVTVFS